MKCNLLFWIYSLSFFIDLSSTIDPRMIFRTFKEWDRVQLDWSSLSSIVKDNSTFIRLKYNYETFNSANAIPFDFDVSRDGRTFVTVIPKLDVIYTLLTVSREVTGDHPALIPYPNPLWHKDTSDLEDCNKLRSVSSITIDVCNRLWVIDNGRIEGLPLCPPKLMAFNLSDDSLISSYEIPKFVAENPIGLSYLVNPVIHTSKSQCNDLTLYMADTEGHGLVVFNGSTFQRFQSYSFMPQPLHSRANIPLDRFALGGGILPMDICQKGKNLVFASLLSRSLYSLNTHCLNEGKMQRKLGADNLFNGQPTAFRFSFETNAFFAALTTNQIVCWNKRKMLCEDDFDTVIFNPKFIHYVSSMKIIPAEKSDNGKEQLLVLSRNLGTTNHKNPRNINFRILKASVRNLIKNNKCAGPHSEKCLNNYGEIAVLKECSS